MIDFTTIQTNLVHLDKEYTSTTNLTMNVLYSKLAVIEFCGWIEVSIDALAKDYLNSTILDSSLKGKVESFIDGQYGFDYNHNVLPIICSAIGASNWENIIDVCPVKDFSNFLTILGNYKKMRNSAAHTNVGVSVTMTYSSPSIVLNDYKIIRPAIQFFEKEIAKL